ncbi:hypothetical protein BDV25DRAFT_143352 [Aspergillus avenaceus]|uniref:Uncharacterized protein n=1 Tax=Aspergillus avenaceus TaxID=36643 RepID=A0A5N6TL31_ASPAV|nr:hypothetical protein BDV25DRAFT_143352 [Aspergillus avenaceus]
MKNLPQEIIDMIWELIPPCAIRRLLSSRVIEEFWPTMHPTPGSTVVQMCSGNIIIYSTYVLDGFYISGIRIDDKLYGYQNDDTPLTLTIPSPLAALLVTYGQYGMRTIEVLSEPTECLPKSSNTKTQEFLSIIHPRSQPFRVQLTWDVTTNDGRSVALGPYIRPKEFYQTALFTGNVSDILGLYYETFSGSRNLASFGVLGRPGVSFHRPTLHDTTLSPPSDFGHSSLFGRSSLLNVLPPYQAMFSSLASLKDIETIDVCRLGSRCTGMLLTSGKDGHTSVLGQWYEDTSFQVEVSRLDHQLDNILAFTLVGTGQDYYVGKIDSLSASENLTDAQIFIHGARGDKIIWIYSHSSDTILLVKG